MVSVLDQVIRRVEHRARARLERREYNVESRLDENFDRGTLDAIAADLAPAARTNRPPDGRVQQAQIVAYLGHRPDRRARILDCIFLPERERRRDIGNRIDVRPFHPLQEQARVSRKTLRVAPLAFGIESVENQTRLARPRYAGNYGELVARNIERDISEIVSARAPDTDAAVQIAPSYLPRIFDRPCLFLAFTRIFVGHLPIKLGQRVIEFCLETPRLRRTLSLRKRCQPGKLIIELDHQTVPLDQILIAVHRGYKTSCLKDLNYRITRDNRTTSRLDWQCPGARKTGQAN